MSSVNQSEISHALPWLRFTITEFLIFILGIGAGLARARMKGVEWPNPLFTTFAVWFVVGMVQSAHRAWQRRNNTSPVLLGQSPRFLNLAGPVFAILLVAISGLLYLDKQERWIWPATLDFVPALAISSAIAFLFFVGVICGYTDALAPRSLPSERRSVLRSLVNVATWCLAAIWLLIVLWNETAVAALVHLAIHGIRLNQPYRRTGIEIYQFPYPEPLTRQFVLGAAAAGFLAVTIGVLLLGFSRAQKRGATARSWLVVGWIGAVLANALLLSWCYFVLLPQWSPILTPFLFSEPYAICVAILLLLVGSALVAARTVAEFGLAEPSRNQTQPKAPLLHRRAPVMILFLIAVIWSAANAPEYGWGPTVDDLQSAWEWLKFKAEVHLTQTDQLVKVAAFLCVFIALWRNWRLRDARQTTMTILPARFFAMWGLWFVTGLVAIPDFLWLGFSLMF